MTTRTERDGKNSECVCFRLGHICGSGHAQEPFALGQRKRAETDAGFVQDVVGETTSGGAAAGHQELPPPVRGSLQPLQRPCCFAPLLTAATVLFPPSSDCLLSDAESSSSDSPVADKRAPGSERAAERAAQQNERERIRLAPQATFANIQVGSPASTRPASRRAGTES